MCSAVVFPVVPTPIETWSPDRRIRLQLHRSDIHDCWALLKRLVSNYTVILAQPMYSNFLNRCDIETSSYQFLLISPMPAIHEWESIEAVGALKVLELLQLCYPYDFICVDYLYYLHS